MRVLIRLGGFINKGAEAMVRTVQSELAARLSAATFAVPREGAYRKSGRLVSAAGLDVLSGPTARAEKMRRLGARILTRPLHVVQAVNDLRWMECAGIVEKVDAILDVGGYAYGDAWSWLDTAAVTLEYLSAARKRGVPYVFMPQAWGPFENAAGRPAYRRMCEEGSLLYARDESSRRFLAELLGRDASAIRISPDIAFRFHGAAQEEGRRLLEELGLHESGGLLVGVAPNQKVYQRTKGTGLQNEYVRRLCEICIELRRHGATVVLVPHEIQPSDFGTTDDRLLCSMIAASLRDDGVFAMTGRYTAEEIKGAIANFDLLIGSRFHALIAALSQGIPVAALGWSHKYAELLGSFGLERFVVPHEQLADVGIRDLIRELLTGRESLKAQVAGCLPAIQRQVDATFEEVVSTIGRPVHA